LRVAAKVPADFYFKFNPGPNHLSHAEFKDLKKSVIQVACESKCVFLGSILLHAIAKTTGVEEGRRNEINRVAFHFNSFLTRQKTNGLVLVDRFSDKQIDGHLREKFSTGVKGMPYSATIRLGNILGFHYSAIGQSHFSSLIDITIGSLRFAVNAYASAEESKKDTAQMLLSQMSPLFFRDPDRTAVSSLSLNFSPNIIKAPSFRAKYESLKAFFEAAGISTAQSITAQRQY
jgi:hypothetical protein